MNNQPSLTIPEVLTRGVAEVLPGAETLGKLMAERPIRVYLGIDPTGSLLTLGHSVVLRKLQQFATLGHEVILLIGNGTVRIGDPTGRDSTRPELTDEQINANFETWKEQASKVLDFSKITIRHNGDWLDQLTYLDMVKLMAKTTVQQLIERDMFQERLQKGLPIHGHEIIYPLLQGYDSVVMDVDLEIGGTDQTFNMMMGRTLQKSYNNKEKWVLTTPIINGTDGRKMSKSYGNFIALTENPVDMYGKLMRINDEMIVEYFTVLTDQPLEEIQAMETAMEAGENPMTFKKQLAFTVTKMYHDQTQAQVAQEHFETTVQGREVPTDLPIVKLNSAELTAGELGKACQPEESNSQIRRLLEQSAVELLPVGEKPTDFNQTVSLSSVQTVRIGKRNYYTIEVV
jgi:tyrosyl-tRNA synthetase